MENEAKITYTIECPECGKDIKGRIASEINEDLKAHLEEKHKKEIGNSK